LRADTLSDDSINFRGLAVFRRAVEPVMPILSIQSAQTAKAEGDSGSTPFVFTVNLDTANAAATTVGWSIYPYSNANAADFVGGVLPSGTLTITAGQTSQTLTVNVQGDTLGEPDEAFYVQLANPSANATVGYGFAYTSISDDDTTRLIVTPADAAKPEGDSGTTPYVFNVARSGKTSVATSVTWIAVDWLSAGTSMSDFAGGVRPTGTVAFAAGETLKTVTVSVKGDTTPEGNEYFELSLSDAGDAQLIVSSAQGLVQDDDTPTLNIYNWGDLASTAKPEGNAGTTPFVFRLTRAGGLGTTSVVDWAVTGAAVNAADFDGNALPLGKVTFAAGETQRWLTVQVAGDLTPETGELFNVALSNPTGGGVLGPSSQATGTVQDDDTPTLSIAAGQTTKPEGNSGTAAFAFTVTRAGNTGIVSTVRWDALTGGTPVNGADFVGGVLPNGTLTFAAGETQKVITVGVLGDTVGEPNETFLVNLSQATNAIVTGPTSAGSTIEDDDTTRYRVDADYYQANRLETDGDSLRHLFVVTRSGKTNGATKIAWSVAGGASNPAAAADFVGNVLPAGTLTFAAGETRKVVTVEVLGDDLVESDETFNLVLGPVPAGAELIQSTASGSIRDDDTTRLGIVASPLATVPEGDKGTTPYVFWVNRTGNTAGTASVDWAVTGVSSPGLGAATADDFAGATLPTGTVAFAAGQSAAAVTVSVKTDLLAESNEGFAVTLSNPVNASLLTGGTSASGTVVDDDTTRVSVAYGNYQQSEGTGTAVDFVFAIGRTGKLTAATAVDWAVQNEPLVYLDPTEDADFAGGTRPSGRVTFAIGETLKSVTVKVAGDSLIEGSEYFRVELGSATAAVGSDLTQGIADDDTLPVMTLSGATQAEGHSGTAALVFQAMRTGSLAGTSQARWTVSAAPSGASANPADLGRVAFPTGTVSFAPGESSKSVTVQVKGDTAVEPDESLVLTLSNPTGATLGAAASATGTIRNDDGAISGDFGVFSLNATIRASEGDYGPGPQVFTVQRTGSLAGTSTVRWQASPNGLDPANGADFADGAFPGGIVTFGFGESWRQVTFAVRGDLGVEPDEGYKLTLSDPVNGTLSPSQNLANGTILDDDATRYQIRGAPSALEGTSANRQLVYTIYRTGELPAGSVLWQATHQGGDRAHATRSDFLGNVLPSGQVSFAAGETAKQLTLTVKGDATPELDETFLVELSNPVGGVLGSTASAGGTILDDDRTWVGLGSSTLSVREGDSGGTPLVFQLKRTGDLSETSKVRWAATGAPDNAATGSGARADYRAQASDLVGAAFPSGWATFAPGEGCKWITLSVAGDTAKETDERLYLTLTEATGASIQPYSYQYQAVATVLDDDGARVSLLAGSPVPPEGNGGGSGQVFNLTRSGDTDGTTVATWRVVQALSGATAGPLDFAGSKLPTGKATFAPGETQKQITVGVAGDAKAEPNEAYRVELTAVTGGVVAQPYGTAYGSIVDDDSPVYTLAGDDHRVEGTGGTVQFRFVVSRTGSSLPAASLPWQLEAGGAQLDPVAAGDFAGNALPKGSVSFAAGQTEAEILIEAKGDALAEPEESFTLRVTPPAGSGPLATVATLVDDDRTLFRADLSGSRSYTEGHTGTVPVHLSVFRQGDASAAGSVKWQILSPANYQDGVDSADFLGGVLPGGVVSFAAGQRSQLISLSIKGDTQIEASEAFAVRLYDPVGGAVDGSDITGSILDDDRRRISVSGPSSAGEGNSGSTPFVFAFNRSGPTTGTASVVWRLSNCPPGSYYGAAPIEPVSTDDLVGGLNRTGTVAFAAGETQRLLTILVAGDTAAEADEGFTLLLADAVGAELTGSQVNATVLDDDTAYLAIQSLTGSQAEGDAGTADFGFKLVRSGRTTGQTVVDWEVQTLAGGADAADFVGGVLPKGKVTFAAGETERTIAVKVKGDTAIEPNELFQVALKGPVGGALRGSSTAIGQIVNDDSLGTTYSALALTQVQIEADTQTRDYVFELSRTGSTAAAGSVGWRIAASGYGYSSPLGYGLASPNDFLGGALPAGTLSFAAGQTAKRVTVSVAGDTWIEQDERFTLVLDGGAQAQSVIRNDDSPIQGSAGANPLAGTDGNDLLIGGAGADTLCGFAGDDIFYFNAPGEGVDTLIDFGMFGGERIAVNSANFGNLPTGPLAADRFAVDTPTTPAQVFVFESATGVLRYDANGSGAGAGVAIATLKNDTGGLGAVSWGQILVTGVLS
jgi:hypothetical protein